MLGRERAGQGCAVNDRASDIAEFDLEITIPGDLGNEFKGAQQGNTVLHESSERARELRIITVTYDATVPRNTQAEAIPRDPSFIISDEGAKAHADSDPDQDGQPPVTGNDMVDLQQN